MGAAGSALGRLRGAPARAVLFRSRKACPGPAHLWALHTAPLPADVRAPARGAAPLPPLPDPGGGRGDAALARPVDPLCPMDLSGFSNRPDGKVDMCSETPDKLVPQGNGGEA